MPMNDAEELASRAKRCAGLAQAATTALDHAEELRRFTLFETTRLTVRKPNDESVTVSFDTAKSALMVALNNERERLVQSARDLLAEIHQSTGATP